MPNNNPKQRQYNPNASIAERIGNFITDKIGITSAPSYTDGYGTQRNPEEGRSEGERKRVIKAVENTGEALLAGTAGASVLLNPTSAIPAIVGGMAGGTAVNAVTRALTGRQSFGDLIDPNKKVANAIGSEKIGNFITESANPGYWLGGYAGVKAAPPIILSGRLAAVNGLNRQNLSIATTLRDKLNAPYKEIVPMPHQRRGLVRQQVTARDNAVQEVFNQVEIPGNPRAVYDIQFKPGEFNQFANQLLLAKHRGVPLSETTVKLVNENSAEHLIPSTNNVGHFTPSNGAVVRSSWNNKVYHPIRGIAETTKHELGHSASAKTPEIYNLSKYNESIGYKTSNPDNQTIQSLYGSLEGRYRSPWHAAPEENFAEYFRHRTSGKLPEQAGKAVSERMLQSQKDHNSASPLYDLFESHFQKMKK